MLTNQLARPLIPTLVMLGIAASSFTIGQDQPRTPDDLPFDAPEDRRWAVEELKAFFRMDKPKIPVEGYDSDEADGGILSRVVGATFLVNRAEIGEEDRSANLRDFGVAFASSSQRETMRFRVEGHASTEGPMEWNQTLSRARADAALEYLYSNYPIPAGALQAVGKGISEPVMDDGAELREESRRVVIVRLWDAEP